MVGGCAWGGNGPGGCSPYPQGVTNLCGGIAARGVDGSFLPIVELVRNECQETKVFTIDKMLHVPQA